MAGRGGASELGHKRIEVLPQGEEPCEGRTLRAEHEAISRECRVRRALHEPSLPEDPTEVRPHTASGDAKHGRLPRTVSPHQRRDRTGGRTERRAFQHGLAGRGGSEAHVGHAIRDRIVLKRSYAHSDFRIDYHAMGENAHGLANILDQTGRGPADPARSGLSGEQRPERQRTSASRAARSSSRPCVTTARTPRVAEMSSRGLASSSTRSAR